MPGLRHFLAHQPTQGLTLGDASRYHWRVMVKRWDGFVTWSIVPRDKFEALRIRRMAEQAPTTLVAWLEPVEVGHDR